MTGKYVMLFVAAFTLAWLSPGQVEAKLYVVTTTADLASIAQEIGGEKAEVESLAAGYQDPHFVDPRPSFIVKLNRADLYVKRGLDLEVGWAPVLETGARNSHILMGAPGYVDASTGIEVLEVPTGPIDRSLGDVHPFGNPHYQLDPKNAEVIAQNIFLGLARVAPEDRDYFAKRLVAFNTRVEAKLAEWEKILAPYRAAKIVTYHKTWEYFTRRFGIRIVGYLEPKPGIAPSPAHLASLITLMQTEGCKLIIKTPYYPENLTRLVAERTGARVLVLPESSGGLDGSKDYFSFMDYCVQQVAEALQGT
jgi:zinc/manganese transport system substrate-binding protein